MMKNHSQIAKKTAVNGILTALTVILLLAAVVLPTNRLSFFALSSFFVSIVIIEYGAGYGWIFYAASNLLAFLVVPSKAELVPYTIFFGLYGIIKFYIERLDRVAVEYILKVFFFNACFAALVLLVREFFLESIRTDFPWWIIIVLLQPAFIMYDYVYTLFIRYYRGKIRKILRL